MRVERIKPTFKPVYITLETEDEVNMIQEALSDYCENSEEASIMYNILYKAIKK